MVAAIEGVDVTLAVDPDRSAIAEHDLVRDFRPALLDLERPLAAAEHHGHQVSPDLDRGDSERLARGQQVGSYNYKAEVEIPPGGAEGMIVTQGGRFGGYGFYVLKGKSVFLWNLVDLKRVRWEAPEVLSPGNNKHTIEFDYKYDGLGLGTLAFNNVSGIGRGGTGVLKVDGKEVARQSMERSIPLVLQWDENFDIGADTGTPVSDDYQVPFRFTGKLDKLTLTIDRPQLSPADIQKLREATRNNKAAE